MLATKVSVPRELLKRLGRDEKPTVSVSLPTGNSDSPWDFAPKKRHR